ncbi:UDP-N-acetylmuramoyl-tripeptide--D-alanyl-D-alanine ligase [Tenacibaculum maritimum]|uniref:UDP-N-acetylmuramoyl-tripeptide--D-alanyl-D- alanine ligase n=1 Tax=Tenacibaculum maritimum TaxID=107401 RepID=UPI0004089C2B|nr:UDP-N-acetylmuramoyl-tripeptide--D-alanyl-D-alanine ligase [Tenacibaculum maritimum]MCD9562919.1 UDP-N-acetylmuramoyl-tripeptide--D-alanyl-D-alanine ligase [Tenacibaculum maritimum]MCD9566378.1 UDP-N-acetylmuramoyl-tripeptide--D-alanyl-D-alanine ligase [Tenacibaculum maritimum]MCD9579720.1 UDP-N-acetylmuramoyl-tripeptide--D-alanyl-D-alanine ligase [Tenacibaculum maritimum]MCD9597833.1 UDP-N-acetylmuramoyl-tripeptide--D-alanyl-D-alanine ligase [Tenacibaculum maritimum]MCD9614167.1 UDP-N-acet
MSIADLYKLYSKHYLVDTDTRKIRENTIFFALKGVNFNGNEYAREALERGAAFSVVDEEKYQVDENIILVDNVLATMQNLAHYHRTKLGLPIIGLTGSNGKTTTKELIKQVLSRKYNTVATVGNLNNHIGVPLTLLSMTPKTEVGIVEMGANHSEEIAFLCEIAAPDYGYITNFGKAHLEGFGSVEGVIKAKSELYDYLRCHNKTVFVNYKDLIQMERTKQMARILLDKEILFQEANPFVVLAYKGSEIRSNLIGKYNYTNIAAAITFGIYFGVSSEEIKIAMESYLPKNNRSQVIKKGSNTIILDAYNANPTSMIAALDNFKSLKTSQKTVILGDMFELGKEANKEHQKLANFVGNLDCENVFFIGEYFSQIATDFLQFKNFEEFKNYLLTNKIINNTILIKGSRGMALERVLDII